MTRTFLSIAALMVVAFGRAPAADKALILEVWPAKAPGEVGQVGPRKVQEPKPDDKIPVQRITNVTRPTLAVFKPARDLDTGAAVLVAPGGGYNILAWDLEGEEVAKWLNSIGVTGIILEYRVPRRSGTPNDKAPPQAQMDGQRAMSLVRSKSAEWGIDSKRIGMLGFSAGGHLTAWASTNYDKRVYEPIDAIDEVSCRPDFTILIYPAYLLRKGADALADDIRVTKETPPTFFAHAANDPITPVNSLVLFQALRKARVSAELHVYASGGHGFGLRSSANPCSSWPQRCGEWMKSQGILEPAASQ
jgi:acetyl esterase/lipase